MLRCASIETTNIICKFLSKVVVKVFVWKSYRFKSILAVRIHFLSNLSINGTIICAHIFMLCRQAG